MLKRFCLLGFSACLLLLGGCQAVPAKDVSDAKTAPTTVLTVHVLDVGKADCILIQSGEHWMLVDAGLNETEELVLDYLQAQGVTHLICAVGTHPDKDHIGGMDAVLREIKTDILLIPPKEVDKKPYTRMIEAAAEMSVPVQLTRAGASWTLGETQITALAPGPVALMDEGENESSIVLMLTHGEVKLLLMADAQSISEHEMIDNGAALKADVIKIGHHGSNKATGTALLSAVAPKDAIISTGEKEGEVLPQPKLLDRLRQAKVNVYRTDLDGNIIFSTDGTTYTIKTDSSGA